MEEVGQKALNHIQFYSSCLWKRYVDDICTAMKVDLVDDFLLHLNSIEPSINFTVEREFDGKLSFLDTEIVHHSDGSLTTKVYRKTTHTDNYLSFDSHHLLQHKNAVSKTLFNRAEKIWNNNEDRVE